jgi:glycosyltransferase involved in cell wall biosynthesis
MRTLVALSASESWMTFGSLNLQVLHVSTAHPPYDTRIFEREALGLVERGCRVDLAINVARSDVRNGVRVHPLGAHGGGRWRRIPRIFRAISYVVHRYDIIHVHDPELLVLAFFALLFRRNVVYDVHEYYYLRLLERSEGLGWIPVPLRTAAAAAYRAVERFIIPRIAGVVVVTSEMADAYRPLAKTDRIAVVRNYPNISREQRSEAMESARPIERPYIISTGGTSYLRCFHVLVEAVEMLRRKNIDSPVVVLGEATLGGYAQEERQALLARAKACGIELPGRKPYIEMLRWVAHACAGVATYAYSQNAERGYPTKLFEYFCFGVPAIASDFGNTGRLTREHDAGITVPWDAADRYADAMDLLLKNETVRAQKSAAAFGAAEHYSFEGELDDLAALYGRITTPVSDLRKAELLA